MLARGGHDLLLGTSPWPLPPAQTLAPGVYVLRVRSPMPPPLTKLVRR